MKKQLLTVLLCLSASLFFAQPVVTMTDLLKVGDVVVTQPCATTTFHPGGAGANQVWDFSQLLPEGPPDSTFYISPVGTPYAANYPASNIVARFDGDQYGYYQTTADHLFYWGQTDPSSALVLSNPATYFKSPATYGSFLLDTIEGSLSLGALNGSVTGHVFFEGDGYGALNTPGGQYVDVLRVKTVTVAVATVPFLGTITDSVFNYSWYKLGIQSPILEMIDDTQWSNGAVVSQVRYVNYFNSLSATKTGEPAGLEAPAIRAFPNPAEGQIQFAGLEKTARMIVRNAAGQVVLDENVAPNTPVNIENLQTGVYFCSVFCDDGAPRVVKFMVL